MEAPHDLEAERQVIGGLLIRPDLILPTTSILSSEDFFFAGHREIFEVLKTFSGKGDVEFDPLQIIHHLRDRDLLEKAGGDAYILRLAHEVLAPANVVTHARRLKNIALRRALVDAAREIQEEAGRPAEDENVFLKKIEDRILGITNRTGVEGLVNVRDIKGDFIEHIEKLMKSRGRITGLITSFDEFDNLTAGLKGGELIILAARPGMGKTTFAMNIAANVALKNQENVIVYSLEMSKFELLTRLVCATAQFDSADLKRGNIPQGRVQDILKAIEDIFQSPLHLDDSGALDIWDCMARTRKLDVELKQNGQSIGLVIVDYLQLLSDPEARKHGRQHEVATISRSLKQLSKQINAPVIALSQMNRSVEQRKGDSRPQLSDLRESGAIEQDADIVMFIHREQFEDENSPEAMEMRGLAEVILAKHRNGPVGSFQLAFRPEISRFDNRPAQPMGAPNPGQPVGQPG